MSDPTEQALAELDSFYAEIDRDTAVLAQRHAERLQCRRGCSACCVDDITVSRAEAARIRRANPDVLRGSPHAPGACAFLDREGACRIYADRPYVCRTQGLPLRWFEEREAVVELRDICQLNDHSTPIEELADADCWLLGPAEARLIGISEDLSPGGDERVALRGMFRPNDDD